MPGHDIHDQSRVRRRSGRFDIAAIGPQMEVAGALILGRRSLR
jgi:hypothetical protein